METILTAENVSKQFRIRTSRPSTLKESVIRRLQRRYDSGHILLALDDVSFSLQQGKFLGIIGHNGAGKSTLLRLLCGLGRPTSGRIHSVGSVGSLLELGTGFHMEMSGLENLITGGILSGLTLKQVRARQDEIIAFSELEEFIDQPIRTYSSGMYLRLAFSTAVHFEPDILLIDEILSVGDSRFQQKCIEKLGLFRQSGKSLIVVSHDLDQMKSLCDDILVLDEGKAVMQSDPESAIKYYHELMRQRTERRASQLTGVIKSGPATQGGNRIGTQEAVIDEVSFSDSKDNITGILNSGGSLTINLSYRRDAKVDDFAMILGIHNEHIKCFEVQVGSARSVLGPLPEKGRFTCFLPELPLLPGPYYVDVGLFPTDWDYAFDYHWHMHTLHVVSGDGAFPDISGILPIRPVWSFSEGVNGERRTISHRDTKLLRLRKED
jgi:lipopolysaccharide transport system ATP-binding protein